MQIKHIIKNNTYAFMYGRSEWQVERYILKRINVSLL